MESLALKNRNQSQKTATADDDVIVVATKSPNRTTGLRVKQDGIEILIRLNHRFNFSYCLSISFEIEFNV